MNRQIKYRAWDIAEKRMYEVLGIRFDDKAHPVKILIKHRNGTLWFHADNGQFELFQFTGMRDKNGKDVYEGDVVRGKSSPSSYPRKSRVFWTDHGWQINMQNVNRFLSSLIEGLEVIGNIYQDKDLLTGGDSK